MKFAERHPLSRTGRCALSQPYSAVWPTGNAHVSPALHQCSSTVSVRLPPVHSDLGCLLRLTELARLCYYIMTFLSRAYRLHADCQQSIESILLMQQQSKSVRRRWRGDSFNSQVVWGRRATIILLVASGCSYYVNMICSHSTPYLLTSQAKRGII